MLPKTNYGITKYYKTINRKPIKTKYYPEYQTLYIWWKCHGINEHGNREYWSDVTRTVHEPKKTLADFIAEGA